MFNVTYNDVKMKAAETISLTARLITMTEDPEKVKRHAQTLQVAVNKLVELCDVEIAHRKGDMDSMISMIEAAMKNF